MKYLLLLLLISPFTIALDLSIPEENVDWSEFEERPGEVWDHPDIKLFQINFPDNPATDNQRKLFESYDAGKHLVAHGVAGSGKTFYASLRHSKMF